MEDVHEGGPALGTSGYREGGEGRSRKARALPQSIDRPTDPSPPSCKVPCFPKTWPQFISFSWPLLHSPMGRSCPALFSHNPTQQRQHWQNLLTFPRKCIRSSIHFILAGSGSLHIRCLLALFLLNRKSRNASSLSAVMASAASPSPSSTLSLSMFCYCPRQWAAAAAATMTMTLA